MKLAPGIRRAWLIVAVMSLVLVSCRGASEFDQADAFGGRGAMRRGAPNFVILMTDDQSTRIFNRALMPRVFSELVDQGVNFTRAYVNVPLCCPSRASILTGLYAHHTGVDTNSGPLERADRARPTFVQSLYQAGYRTMLAGKYLNSEPCHPRPGWDRWVCTKGGGQVDPEVNIDGREESLKGFTTDLLADEVVDFIGRSRAEHRPFFAYYAPKSPHLPADDPRARSMRATLEDIPSYDAQPHPETLPTWVRRDPMPPAAHEAARRNFERMAQQMPPFDAAIGRILDSLGPDADNTFIVFLSDNGYLYGEHRWGNKGLPYEESVRVPFVIRFPRMLPPERSFESSALVANIDIAPTVMDLAGITWNADGRSLLPILEGKHQGVRDGVLLEWCRATGDDCVEENKVGPPPYWGVEAERFVYFEYATGEKELYDLRSDPYQLTNVADIPKMRSVQRTLAEELARLVSEPAAPETTLALAPVASTARPPLVFSFFSHSLSTVFRCRLIGPEQDGGWTGCATGKFEVSSLQPGRYAFQVQAVDARGMADPTPAERAFVIPE